MEVTTGVFADRTSAETAVNELDSAGFTKDRIGFLTPGTSDARIERSLPITDTEDSGMGKAMGGAVGGAIGAAGGATLGAAAATAILPGVGPVIAIGLLGAALLGAAGATTGAVVGDTLEDALGEGIPHEDLYLYEDALRHGRSVVIVFAEDADTEARAKEIITRNGSEDLDTLRESWWTKVRNEEQDYYQQSGRDFERDEVSYRRGFQAALHPQRRGKSYAECEAELRKAYDDSHLDTAFRHGYERGARHQHSVTERQNV